MKIPEERKKLAEFETDWEQLKRKMVDLNIYDYYNGKKPKFNVNTFQTEF